VKTIEICASTNIECSHCENVCDKILTPQRVAIIMLGNVNALLRSIESNEEIYIRENIDKIISNTKYFKSVFKY
jgi:hypothetical protein